MSGTGCRDQLWGQGRTFHQASSRGNPQRRAVRRGLELLEEEGCCAHLVAGGSRRGSLRQNDVRVDDLHRRCGMRAHLEQAVASEPCSTSASSSISSSTCPAAGRSPLFALHVQLERSAHLHDSASRSAHSVLSPSCSNIDSTLRWSRYPTRCTHQASWARSLVCDGMPIPVADLDIRFAHGWSATAATRPAIAGATSSASSRAR